MALVKKKIIIHTEQLNRGGYWIKTDGIDLTGYNLNNMVLNGHEFAQRVGLGVRLQKSVNGDMTAYIDFNENSELGKQLKADFEAGYIKAASIGVLPLKWSNEPQYMKPGQTKPTMIACELLEFSLVTIPNNAGAVVFKQNSTGEYIKLGISDLEFNVLACDNTPPNGIEHNISQMKKIALVLGLAETASEDDILKKVTELQSSMATMKAEGQTLLAAKEADIATLEGSVLAIATKVGLVTEKNKATFEKLAKVDLGLVLTMATEKLDTHSSEKTQITEAKEDVRISKVVEALKETTVDNQSAEKTQGKKERPKEFVGGKSMQERMARNMVK